jgi:hypothetical protein
VIDASNIGPPEFFEEAVDAIRCCRLELVLPIRGLAVDDGVGAQSGHHRALLGASCDADNLCTRLLCELDSHASDCARGAGDQDGVPWFRAQDVAHSGPRGQARHPEDAKVVLQGNVLA